ncbi:hypothetical protein, partial [Streptomyces sp. NPDC024089]|uniref:hypothetical protein n=1 Tax=Streptomyces sp. NPDC024089 TaxID=3154328 RepID=UPI0033CDBF86
MTIQAFWVTDGLSAILTRDSVRRITAGEGRPATVRHTARRPVPAGAFARRGPDVRASVLRVLVVDPAHELAQLAAGGLQEVVAVGL